MQHAPAGTASPRALPIEELSPLGFADAIDALSIRVVSHVALPWSDTSLPMTYDEERDFLRRLVAEEFSPEAVVDRRDELQNTIDESAHHVYLHGALVYSISEQHVRRHNEADIRRQLRDARTKFDSLLGLQGA